MAKQDNGFLGGFSGRLGTAVGYQWRGKWCVRSLPGAMANPRTAAQQAHREMFKQEVQLAGRMNWVLRETLGAISLEMGLTAGNLFVKSNQHAFAWSDGHLAVDWASLVLSAGPVAPVRFGVPTVSGGTTLTVGFEKNPLHGRAENYDRVYVYVYCPSLEKGYLTAPEYRKTQSVSAVLPEMFAGREVQLWGMVQDAQGRWSETLYIGAFSLTLDPTPTGDGDYTTSNDTNDNVQVTSFEHGDIEERATPADATQTVSTEVPPPL